MDDTPKGLVPSSWTYGCYPFGPRLWLHAVNVMVTADSLIALVFGVVSPHHTRHLPRCMLTLDCVFVGTTRGPSRRLHLRAWSSPGRSRRVDAVRNDAPWTSHWLLHNTLSSRAVCPKAQSSARRPSEEGGDHMERRASHDDARIIIFRSPFVSHACRDFQGYSLSTKAFARLGS